MLFVLHSRRTISQLRNKNELGQGDDQDADGVSIGKIESEVKYCEKCLGKYNATDDTLKCDSCLAKRHFNICGNCQKQAKVIIVVSC